MIRKVGSAASLVARQLLGNQDLKRPWIQLLSNRSITTTAYASAGLPGDLRGQQRREKALAFFENMDEDLKKQKCIIEMEYQTLRDGFYQVPEKVSDYDWYVILTEHTTPSARRKYFHYLFSNEKSNEEYRKRQQNYKELQDRGEKDVYREQMCIHVPRREKVLKHSKGVQSMRFGNPIIFDLDYNTSRREATSAITQMNLCYGLNTRHPEPFHIYFTGYESANERYEEEVLSGGLFSDMLFVDSYPKSFTDLFPKERLVYLTPNGPMLDEYSGDDIYVIAGLVDLHYTAPQSLPKAKELGIRCGSLPIHKYFSRSENSGQTVLTLDCVFKTMLDVNLNHNWGKSLRRHLPSRRYVPLDLDQKRKGKKLFQSELKYILE